MYVSVPAAMMEPSGGYFFRSDTRDPETIFATGFKPRETIDHNLLIYRLAEQDIELDSAISITHSFEAAAIFPQKLDSAKLPVREASKYKAPGAETWVYLVYAEQWFDTQDIQARFAAHAVPDLSVAWVRKADENLFADEAATTIIAPGNVVSANRVRRDWSGADYFSGGQASIMDARLNSTAMENKHHHRRHNSKSRHYHFGKKFALPTPTTVSGRGASLKAKYQAPR